MNSPQIETNDPEKPQVDDLTFYSLLSLLQGGMWLLNDLEVFLKKYKISHGRFSILLAVLESGNNPINPNGLARMLGRSKPTISKMLKKLQDDGLIKTSSSREDSRALTVELLKKARLLLDKIIPEYNRRILQMSSELTRDDKYHLLHTIAKINFLNPYRKVVVNAEL